MAAAQHQQTIRQVTRRRQRSTLAAAWLQWQMTQDAAGRLRSLQGLLVQTAAREARCAFKRVVLRVYHTLYAIYIMYMISYTCSRGTVCFQACRAACLVCIIHHIHYMHDTYIRYTCISYTSSRGIVCFQACRAACLAWLQSTWHCVRAQGLLTL